jgi:hypothetical protein
MTKFQVGDRVLVRKPADVERSPRWLGEMEKFDGTEQKISEVRYSDCVVKFVGDSLKWAFHFDWLEPVKPKTLNVGDPVEPIRSWVPDGYSVIDIAVPDVMAAEIGDGNALVWSQANFGERYLSSAYNRVKIRQTRTDDFLNVIVPTTQPAPKYREPTSKDVGKMVDVRDDSRDQWAKRKLLAVIDDDSISHRFICRILEGNPLHSCWRYAQIKIEEPK